MAIDFSLFNGAAARSTTGGRKDASAEREKTQFWVNIGYETGDEEYPFVSLPVGIPLDGQERKKTSSRNSKFAQFAAAQNAILDQFMTEAKALKPGEDIILGEKGTLQIQIRRIQEEKEEVVANEDNMFLKNILMRG